MRHPTRLATLAGALCAAAIVMASTSSARQDAPPAEPDPGLDAVRLMDAAKERLIVGDTTAAIARALLARQLDPDIEIPVILIERAQMAQAVEGVPRGPAEQALADLRMAIADLERQVREQSRTLDGVTRDLSNDARAEPVVQRLEREIDDVERTVQSLERDLQRLQREVDRLRQ